jgi:hypothetical protein
VLINIITGVSPPHFDFFVFYVLSRYDMSIIRYLILFCTYNTVKRVSKRSSFRYAFQEHLLKILMLAVTHSELLLGAFHGTLNSKLTIVRLFTSVTITNPLYYICQYRIMFWNFFKSKGQNRKNIVLYLDLDLENTLVVEIQNSYLLYSFYKPFCRTCLLYKKRVRQNGIL